METKSIVCDRFTRGGAFALPGLGDAADTPDTSGQTLTLHPKP